MYYEKCELGKGATGNVYRGKIFCYPLGKNKIDQTNIAVKVINENKICSDVIAYLLKNEINAVQRVSDPNVLKTFDVLRENGYCYIIMELYSGGNLR